MINILILIVFVLLDCLLAIHAFNVWSTYLVRSVLKKNKLDWNKWKPNGPRVFESRRFKIIDVLRHKWAYLTVQCRYWHLTLRGIFHDCDKLILLIFARGLTPKEISEYHKIRSHHHSKAKTEKDFRYQIFDFECSALTKPDAPMRAREYIAWKHSKGGYSDEDYKVYVRLMDEMGIPE